MKQGLVLPQFGEWTANWKYSQVPGFGFKSCMINVLVPWSTILVQQTQLEVGGGVTIQILINLGK